MYKKITESANLIIFVVKAKIPTFTGYAVSEYKANFAHAQYIFSQNGLIYISIAKISTLHKKSGVLMRVRN